MKLQGKTVPGKGDAGEEKLLSIPDFIKRPDGDPEEDSSRDVGSIVQALVGNGGAALNAASSVVDEPPAPAADAAPDEPAATAESVPDEPAAVEPDEPAPEKGESAAGSLGEPIAPDNPPSPAIIFTRRATIRDFESLPENVIELRDPFRSSVLLQLRTFIARIRLFKRSIDEEEKEALSAILERLKLLRGSCVDAGQSDWVDTIDLYIADLNEILGNNSKELEVVAEDPQKITEGTFGKILRALGMKK